MGPCSYSHGGECTRPFQLNLVSTFPHTLPNPQTRNCTFVEIRKARVKRLHEMDEVKRARERSVPSCAHTCTRAPWRCPVSCVCPLSICCAGEQMRAMNIDLAWPASQWERLCWLWGCRKPWQQNTTFGSCLVTWSHLVCLYCPLSQVGLCGI